MRKRSQGLRCCVLKTGFPSVPCRRAGVLVLCLAFTLPLAFLPPSPPPCLLEPTVACVRGDAVTQDTVHSERPPLAPTCPVLRDVPPAPGRCFALSPRGGFPQASGRGPNGCRSSFVLVTADALPGATGRSC